MSCDLVLVRHGETEGESSIRLYGVTDIPLSGKGREQMRRAARTLSGLDFRSAFSSPLERSRESAEIALAGRDVPILAVEGFRENKFRGLGGMVA